MKSSSHFPTVGILGAGQIARILIEAATRLNLEIKLLSKSTDESAALIANNVTVGDVNNYSDLSLFATETDVITFNLDEFPFEKLKKLENQGQIFRPQISTLEQIGNREFVKKTLLNANLPFQDEVVNFERQLSVQAARSEHGQTVVYSVLALKISELFNINGVFTIDFVDLGNDKFLVSHIKLGPTNSGHWTIDGATTSQFENHLRAILNLPLGSPKLLAPVTVMVNVLGGQYLDMYKPFLHCMAHDPALRLHLYGKEVKEGQKVGHVNISGNDLNDLLERAHHAADYLTGRITE